MDRIALTLSLITAAYWLSGLFYNPYNHKITGIIFEILWLPMILLIFLIPLYWINKLFKRGRRGKS